MSQVAKWILPAAGGKDAIIGTVKATVGFLTGNASLIAAGVAQVAGVGKTKAQDRQASITSLSVGEGPREMVAGLCVTGGSLVDVFNHGGLYGTDSVTRCIALADHAVDAIVGYYVDDRYYAWPGDGAQSAFSGKLSLYFRNAVAGGVTPPSFVTAADVGWVSTDKLDGLTHIWVRTDIDDKVWTRGHPQLRFLLRGLKVYDPRFDTALGYSGPSPQTWEDRSTHVFTTNAALLRYAFTRGIYAEGHQGAPEHLLIGRGLSADEAPPARIIAAANLCDEVVDSKPRYAAAGVIRASDEFIQVEEWFAGAMAGVIVQREGGVEIEPGQAKAVVKTITDADLVTGEAVTFSQFLPDGSDGRINTVVPSYIEPAQGWKDHAGPVRRSIPHIVADGGPRELGLSLPLVTDGAQADRCAEIARLISRLERRASIVLPPDFAELEEGDWIAWTSARYHGGATVKYRIEAWGLDEKWRMRPQLREISTAVFGAPDPLAGTADPEPSPPTVTALALTGVTATAVALGTGSTVPAILFGWATPDAAVIGIQAEVRVAGGGVISPTRTNDVAALSLRATNGVVPSASLEARLVPIADPTRTVTPSAWIPVSTGGVTAGTLVGQSRFATATTLSLADADIDAPWTAIDSRPTELMDGRVAAALDASGDLARNLTTARLNASNVLRYPGGAAYTGSLAATDDTTVNALSSGLASGAVKPAEAATITGRGALALLNTVASGQIDTGAVTTTKVLQDAVTPSYVGYTTGTVNWTASAAEKDLQTVASVVVTRGRVVVRASVSVDIDPYAVIGTTGILRLYRDGTEISQAQVTQLYAAKDGSSYLFSRQWFLDYAETPGAGTYTYKITFDPGHTASGDLRRRFLSVTPLQG